MAAQISEQLYSDPNKLPGRKCISLIVNTQKKMLNSQDFILFGHEICPYYSGTDKRYLMIIEG